MKNMQKILRAAEQLSRSGRLGLEKNSIQHGSTTVFRHSVGVALVSLAIAEALHLRVNDRSLIRGALLHDYFLYDWHKKTGRRGLHGLRHPKKALENAREDFTLDGIEEDIISRHMFPLTPVPPRCREAWLVCIADKYCALSETLKPRLASIRCRAKPN